MTRNDHRAQCIEAMEEAFYKRSSGTPTSVYDCMSAAFDSLHGIAVVNPIEATNEMIRAGVVILEDEPHAYSDAISCWNAMSAAGDLTNLPEKKP